LRDFQAHDTRTEHKKTSKKMTTMSLLCRVFSLLQLASLLGSGQAIYQGRRTMVGAYFPAMVNDPFVQSVADFALSKLTDAHYQFLTVPVDTLHSTVVQAQQQVVAGRNYKLLITISNAQDCLGAFQVTIYDHFGDLSITQWGEEMTCEQAKAIAEEKELQDSDSDSDSSD
jgi:hypothetical protein